MPRPLKCRAVSGNPEYRCFGPFPDSAETGVLEMTFDEFEAIRLVDVEGLYQEEAAQRMLVSRQTFGNILASARRKLGEMLVLGRKLNVTGGKIMVSSEERRFGCVSCGHQWPVAYGVGRPAECPSCASENIHRMSPGGGFGGGRRGGGRCRSLKTGLEGPGNGRRHEHGCERRHGRGGRADACQGQGGEA